MFTRRSHAGLLLAVTLLSLVSAVGADAPTYVQADLQISAGSLAASDDGGQSVLIARGGFQLTLGEQTLQANEAVVWIRAWPNSNRRDLTVYLSGQARANDVRQASGDAVMLVRLYHQGRLRAVGGMHSPTQDDLDLLAIARDVRKSGIVTRVGTPSVATAARPTPATAPSSATASAPAPAKETIQLAAMPVSWRWDQAQIEKTGEYDYQIIVRGNVYLSQEDARSGELLELRSQEAVVFIHAVKPNDPRQPYAPKLEGMQVAEGREVRITGVYLENDVVISRGERFMRAPRAYYDFETNRALAVDAVFRTIQEQRNIPIYVRAKEARSLSSNEWLFRNAKISTSEFYSPAYSVGGSKVYLRDETAYDLENKQVSERTYSSKVWDTTYEVRSVPIFYWPYSEGQHEEGFTPLRKVSAGSMGDLGFGVQSEWELFRLLGLLRPEGTSGRLDLEAYTEGFVGGTDLKYSAARGPRQYSGYWRLYGVLDESEKDNFGKVRKDIPAEEARGRFLARHKELLPQDLELQFEVSYLCDRNFLERYFPNEFYNGKEQETLLYAKKQQDFWAATSLLKYRLNRFDTQGEAFPELGLHIINPPLPGDILSVFSESRAGFERFMPANYTKEPDSDVYGRMDTRNEADLPLGLGPLKVVPYVVGRETYWGETVDLEDRNRLNGQVGVKSATNVWRVYPDASSRFWDVNQLKHVVTPYGGAWLTCNNGAEPDQLYPIDPGVEKRLGDLDGATIGLLQRLATKRGKPGEQHTVDWMRLNVAAAFFNDNNDLPSEPANGYALLYRPEYSTPRDYVNGDYAWAISDATSFLSDANWDVESSHLARANMGFAVERDPQSRYYLGWRYIDALSASVGTIGTQYQLNRKYSFSVFEQYDFDFEDGTNLATSLTITRKFPRWYVAVTISYDQRNDDVLLFVSLWPEGLPEVRLGGDRISLFGGSNQN